MDLKKVLRTVPISQARYQLHHINTLLRTARPSSMPLNLMIKRYYRRAPRRSSPSSRGAYLGGAMAYKLGCGLVPARQAGKLPYRFVREE